MDIVVLLNAQLLVHPFLVLGNFCFLTDESQDCQSVALIWLRSKNLTQDRLISLETELWEKNKTENNICIVVVPLSITRKMQQQLFQLSGAAWLRRLPSLILQLSFPSYKHLYILSIFCLYQLTSSMQSIKLIASHSF